ncbi:hypothetical protein SCHPADRAFT_859791 [Schizopora paradoxa]|uniref:BTB domain-containing protein n=1 Tax=Schizopora paradoxa TaxID=27342 RepID=A0A0H2RSB1_9AGAM|nr:hypothetical protein SCHPADRAFT_859791 [Schizopora paradoxa]
MTPPTKRARTSSTSSETIAVDAITLSKLKQHESLWFEDGNIVLATDVHLYSVHRGVLARNSTFFKEMLELPNVGNTSISEVGSIGNGDSWEGKPLVRMVGDSDEDVYHILMAIYDSRFYRAQKPSTLPIILSLVRMSTKYDFPSIRDEVTSHLEPQYPTDLKLLKVRDSAHLVLDFKEEDDFQLLVVAEQCNVKAILPLLYLDCAALPLDDILSASEAVDLQRSSFLRILRGHEQLSKYTNQYGTLAFLPEQSCMRTCQSARIKLFAKYVKDPPKYAVHRLLLGNEPDDYENLRPSVCEICTKASSEALKAFQSEVWNAIPGMFELGTWEDYKRE